MLEPVDQIKAQATPMLLEELTWNDRFSIDLWIGSTRLRRIKKFACIIFCRAIWIGKSEGKIFMPMVLNLSLPCSQILAEAKEVFGLGGHHDKALRFYDPGKFLGPSHVIHLPEM